MKIRTDFVTNSSSSTFYVSKKATLVFEGSGARYPFALDKENSKTVNTEEPKGFAQFVNWNYLYTGKKPTVSNVISGKGMKAYAQYLIDNKKEAGAFYMILDETEYSIGYGESIGDDFDRCEKLIFSHLHPALSQYYAGKNLFAEINDSGKVEPFSFWVEKHRVTGDPEGDRHYYCVDSYHGDYTDQFYWILYENAGSPKLDFDLIEGALTRSGLDAQAIHKMKEKGMQIVYFANKTQQNDVIVYFTEGSELTIQPISRFLKEL